jgi:hypothetical protein
MPERSKYPNGSAAVKLDALAGPPANQGFGRRFYLVNYLPTYAATLYLLTLVWAGARGYSNRSGHGISFKAAWTTASRLSVSQVVAIALAVILLAVLLQPFQLAMMRLVEGSWPSWLGARPARWRQKRRKRRLEKEADLPEGPRLTDEEIQRAGVAGYKLRSRFPLPDYLLRPTALGNVLAAMEDGAGWAYGLDAVTAWPRLYPLLDPPVKSLVDDRRDTMDAAARMAVTMTVTAVISLVLLLWSGWWISLFLIPLGIAIIAYQGAVQSALAYAEAVYVSFDLNRDKLLTALRMKLPTRQNGERIINGQWCDFWRQGMPLPGTMEYTSSKRS